MRRVALASVLLLLLAGAGLLGCRVLALTLFLRSLRTDQPQQARVARPRPDEPRPDELRPDEPPAERLARAIGALAAAGADERRTLLPLLRASLVDSQELARRSMGDDWSRLTAAQQSQLGSDLVLLLDRSLLRMLPRALVLDRCEQKLDGDEATVTMVIGLENHANAEMVWKLHRTPRGWLAWDVVADEVSLVRNYRTQFNHFIREQGVEALLGKIRKKAG